MRNVLLLICLIALAFSPCLKAGFVYWDDDLHLLENPLTEHISAANIKLTFQTVINKTYIPLTALSWTFERAFFGLNPFFYHLDNLILHILIVLLIYSLVGRLGFDSRTAFLTALLFGAHPMHVESVAWVTQRKDMLYSLFYILSLSAYLKYLTDNQKRFFVLSVIWAILSILSKPMALSLPLVLLLLDWYRRGSISPGLWLNKIPFIVVMAPIAWITYMLNARVPFTNLTESLLIWAWSATFYIKKFFTPFVLLPLYQIPKPVSLLNPSYTSSLLMLAALPALLYKFRRDRLLTFALGFYAYCTFFLWRYDNTVDITIVADRFMYLPSLGICLWLSYKATDLWKTKYVPAIVMAALVFLMVQTFIQCRIWQNDITLWSRQINYDTLSAHAYNSRGVALGKIGQTGRAIDDLNHAIELRPDHAISYYNRGHILSKTGQSESALKDFGAALAINPQHTNSLIERGTLLSRMGKLQEALNDLTLASRLEPTNAAIFNNRGIVYKKMGLKEDALRDYTRGLELNPRSGPTHVNRAKVWQELGRYYEAIKDLQEADRLGTKIDPQAIEQLKSR